MRSKPRILVIGDPILDTYWRGRAARPNPEAVGQVFVVEATEDRPGGAAAVAAIAAGLGAEVLLLSVVGNDRRGDQLWASLDSQHVRRQFFIEPQRVTTHKIRSVENGRVRGDGFDLETMEPISREMADRLLRRIAETGPWDSILVADYAKGVVTPRLLDGLSAAAGQARILIDPARGRPWSTYPDGALIKANWADARLLYRDGGPCGPAGVVQFRGRYRLFVITKGADGIYWREGAQSGHEPTAACRVVDVAGAGDTVLAVLGIAMSWGMPLGEACRLANRAAGVQVERLGVVQIRPEELGPPFVEHARVSTPDARRKLRIAIDFDGTFTADQPF
jgi:rfaE bifunctional protein kinase chain/domain